MIVETEFFSAHCGLCLPLFLVTSSSTVVVVVGVVVMVLRSGLAESTHKLAKWR
jgi:hypothetical protein